MDTAFDFQMPLLVVSLAGAAGVIIYLISVFGIREKTFEEAIASQKEISQELLGKKEQQKKKAVKRKVKAKKEDKPPKEKEDKPREKEDKPPKEKEQPEKEKEKEVHHSHHPHVEICPQPIILDENLTPRRPSLATAGRRDSIKSILVNKAEVSPVGEGDVIVEANHFENRHPKDDFELKKQISTEDEMPNGNGLVDDIENEIEEEIIEAMEAVQVSTQPVAAAAAGISENNAVVNNNARKPSKKSKKATLVAPPSDLNATKLVSVIDKTSLTRDEIQNLIEYLLNRQVDAGIATDWVNKSKADTTASLKKALAEKEAQLAEEKVMGESLQLKLKDVRQEYNAEKNRFLGMKKALEDRITALQQESQQYQIRIQQLNVVISEKANLERQLQESQRRYQALENENVNIKKVLSQDQGFRMKAEGLERELETIRTQCAHLDSQLKAALHSNQELGAQNRGLQEHARNLETKLAEYEHLQGFHAQLQEREAHLVNELKHMEAKVLEAEGEKNGLKDKLREIEEEVRVNKEEAERKVEEFHQNEKHTKNLLEDAKSNLTQLENQLKSKESELKKLQDEKNSSTEELHLRNKKLEEDAVALEKRLGAADSTVTGLRAETQQLTDKISKTDLEIHSLNSKNKELEEENSKLAESLRLSASNLEVQSKAAESHIEVVERTAKEAQLHSIQDLLQSISGITVQKNSEGWMTDFMNDLTNRLTPPKEDNSADLEKIEKLEGEVQHYQRTLQNTEAILSRLEQSIADSEKGWEEKLQAKNAELEEALKAPSLQANVAHLEVELNLQRESNAKLIQLNRDLEEKLSNSHSQKEETVSIASLEELKVENQELRAEVERLSHAPHSEVATNGNGTSPKLNSSPSTVSVDSKGSEHRSADSELLSPTGTGETKKKKKVLSGLFGSKNK